uniref:Uncharacterized protein n=1 Tax=Bactrocera latifrons TaxID=174628 RepID=A0A0K8U300_BACLA
MAVVFYMPEGGGDDSASSSSGGHGSAGSGSAASSTSQSPNTTTSATQTPMQSPLPPHFMMAFYQYMTINCCQKMLQRSNYSNSTYPTTRGNLSKQPKESTKTTSMPHSLPRNNAFSA